jgi:signal peptidase I
MTDQPPPEAESSPEKKEGWWETIRFFGLLFLAAIAIRSLLFAPFSIPSGSMLPNLMIGDYLFVAKWPFGFSRYSFPFGIIGFGGRVFERLPERGDIVVFRSPNDSGDDVVKRVIGLPGDTVAVRGGAIVLNGQAVPRRRIADYAMPITPNSPCRVVGNDADAGERLGAADVCFYPRWRETLPGGRSYDVLDQGGTPLDDRAPVTVPAGHLFVMGDNRDDSADSRVPSEQNGIGLLPVENLLGRASIAFWSTDGSAEWLLPWTWFTAARWGRIGQTW